MNESLFSIADDPRINDVSLWREVANTVEDLQKLVLEDRRVDSTMGRTEGMRYLRKGNGRCPSGRDRFPVDKCRNMQTGKMTL
jgi:hypothetical protein